MSRGKKKEIKGEKAPIQGVYPRITKEKKTDERRVKKKSHRRDQGGGWLKGLLWVVFPGHSGILADRNSSPETRREGSRHSLVETQKSEG